MYNISQKDMKENVYNTSKLAFHPEKITSLANQRITAPIYVRIKPTNKCNHGCSYCSYAPNNECPVSEIINMKDEIPKSKLLEILDDFKEIGVKAVTYSGGGEPLIYPNISEIMKKTLDSEIDLSIITNGQKLSGEKAEILKNSKWVRVSSSENDAKIFSEIRKRPESWFYSLVNNIKNFAKIKNPDCELGINYVVYNDNFDRVYNSAKFFMGLGVNHIKFTPVYNPNFEEYHNPIKDKVMSQIEKARTEFSNPNFTIYDTYQNDFELTGLSKRSYPKCYINQIIPVIGADSIVYFCHDKTYTKNGALGSIKDMSFKELWFSKESKEKFDNFDPRISCKHHCTYDSRNILTGKMIKDPTNIKSYQPESDKHKNFV